MSEGEGRREAIPNWLKQCREMLEAHPELGVTQEALALHVGKHPVHLSKAFGKLTVKLLANVSADYAEQS